MAKCLRGIWVPDKLLKSLKLHTKSTEEACLSYKITVTSQARYTPRSVIASVHQYLDLGYDLSSRLA